MGSAIRFIEYDHTTIKRNKQRQLLDNNYFEHDYMFKCNNIADIRFMEYLEESADINLDDYDGDSVLYMF